MILNYKKWRLILSHYLVNHGLPRAGSVDEEKGWSANVNRPFGKPARHVLRRVLNHMVADKKLSAKYDDGTLNKHVQAILNPPPPKQNMGEKILVRALKEVGVHEVGVNGGTRVHYYQSSTGAYNQAWCASFCSKMAQEEGWKGGVSAGAWNLTDTCGTRINLTQAKPGDFVSLNTGDGHVGILEGVHADRGVVTLVAGNTSDSVKVKDYPISMIHSICRCWR